MTMTIEAPFTVSRRRDGEPEADLTGMVLIHRALRCGPRTLAHAVCRMPAADRRTERRRRRAVARFGRELVDQIRTHHEREDDVLWPVIAASAGPAVDLRSLTDDHEALGPLLRLVETLLERYAAGRDEAGAPLGAALRSLADHLDEHISAEEAALFPVIRKYVSAGDFERCERMFQKGASLRHLAFLLPWVLTHTTPRERDEVLIRAGAPLRVMVRLTTPGYRRLVTALG